MADQFYIVLPSNSSMLYFSNNTTTRFITQMPQQLRLNGAWNVALTEIQIPMSFQHISADTEERRIKVEFESALIPPGDEKDIYLTNEINGDPTVVSLLQPGNYKNIDSLIDEINKLSCIENHFTLSLTVGGYVHIERVCGFECCVSHNLGLSSKLIKVLGFNAAEKLTQKMRFNPNEKMWSLHPANLLNGLPSMAMVYTDIVQPIVTGDVQARLLRAVSLNMEKLTYGSVYVKSCAPPMYLPLLFNSFQTIELDIRDQHGDPLPFDYGTLTAVLHFKRIS